MKKALALILSCLVASPSLVGAAEPRDPQAQLIDPALSYKMSRDGWFFRWGDGHLYNGEVDEAKKIWRSTLLAHLLTLAGAGIIVAGQTADYDGSKNDKNARALATGFGSFFAACGLIGYTVVRNRDVSTAPIHAVSINVGFGGPDPYELK